MQHNEVVQKLQSNFSTTKNLKESGIPWLGKIPKHWEMRRVKHLFEIGRGRVISQEELDDSGMYPVYSSQTQDNGVLGYIRTYDFDCEQITWTTDGVNAGTVFLRRGKHNCTNVCGTLRPKNKNENIVFLTFALQNATPYYKRPDTNGAKIMNNEMAEILLIYPPLKEQQAIADFLDKKTRQIEEFIDKKQKLITLLEEKKQTLINQCVTQGLDSSTSLKDSGVEWLGKIPTHWEIKKLKYISKVVLGKMLCNEKQEGYSHCYYLKSKNLQWLNVDISQVEKMWFSEYEKSIYRVKKDDLLVSEGGEVGKTCIWNDEIEECYIQNSVHKITMDSLNHPRFFLYVFFVYGKKGVFESIVNRVSIAHLVLEKLINIDFAVPPLEEQKTIVEYLDTQIAKIDLAISKIKSQINLIKEYKTTLISEAVCGRIGVEGNV